MPHHCIVNGCHNTSDYHRTLSFHSIPFKEPVLLDKWFDRIKRDKKHVSLSNCSKVCSSHFKKNDFTGFGSQRRRLKKDAVPSKFSWTELAQGETDSSSEDDGPEVKKRRECQDDDEENTDTASEGDGDPIDPEFKVSQKIQYSVSHLRSKCRTLGKEQELFVHFTGCSSFERFKQIFQFVCPTEEHNGIIYFGTQESKERNTEEMLTLLRREVKNRSDSFDGDGSIFGRNYKLKNSGEANGHHTKEAVPPCSPKTNDKQHPEVTEEEQFWKDYHQTKKEAILYRKACKTFKLLSLPNIKDDDRAFEMYTGLPNYAIFEVLHDYLKPNAKCSGEKTARDTPSNSAKRSLTSQEEFFLFLVTIKTGNLASDLALRFGITKPTFSVIFASWAVFVSNMLDDFSKTIMKPHARNFGESEEFIVIDCSALLLKKPSQLNKDRPQKQGLLCVGMSNNGTVISVLGSLRGSASVEVVSSTSEDLNRDFNQFKNSDTVEYHNQDETVGKSATIINIEQLYASEPTTAKTTARHINMTLTRLWQFRYLRQQVEPSNVDLYEQVFKACAYLTNFQLAS